ncbi:imelysin family protein [Aureispira anguillae]|uniref:Imelysin family protein n=1 Tax=Aureispira anguillae TaxID=2864201 RepID=A0A915VMH2_9BACT|nr:imelysin family protein [Aureispira anguillae]BDS09475.1 imelysin family protein [Aureispira anguillae]
MQKIILSILMGATLLFSFSACETPDNNPCATEFDQLSLLSNIGNNIILPSYQSLAHEADSLNTAAISFANTPTAITLENLRNKFQTAWTTWQTAAIFEFGPAATENLRSSMNNFPVFVTRLNDAIASGSYDLTSETYSYTRGFPALDYLLYGTGATNADILNAYSTAVNASNRKQFLKDVTALILQKANAVYDAWKPTGANYLNTFTSTEGVANGKPLSDLVNQLNQSYELIKNEKLGIPISAKTGYVPLLPENVEAYYSGQSIPLAITAIQAAKHVFLGMTNGNNGVGLDDYLLAANAKKGSEDLHTVIQTQYDLAISALTDLQPSTLHDAINNNIEGVKAAYAAAQNQMVNTKTSMPAVLCISITYIDQVDDGD